MPSRSWTDDLPKCQHTGVAYYPVVSELETDEASDSNHFRYFYCQIEEDTTLYGIFDAHNGSETAHFVLQRMAAEILLGQLNDKYSDEEIKEVLRNGFLSVEKAYIESIDGLVAERTSLQFELPEGLSPEKLNQNCGDILGKLKKIDEQLSIGATSVIALIHTGKLYVANVGNSRALLCKTDDNCVLRVVQLSVDHSLSNEDELLRLSQLGLDIERLREADALGNQSSTRCLGNYLVKGLYRAFPDMRTATSEPVIAIPEVHGPIKLDQSCRFLILMSDGLYRSLQESTETEQVNKRFAQMVVEQFRTQPTLTAVCQAVVNQTINMYQEYCSLSSQPRKLSNRNTLLIRNFNFQLPNAPVSRSPMAAKKPIDPKSTIFLQTGKSNDSENSVIFNNIDPQVFHRLPGKHSSNETSPRNSHTNVSNDSKLQNATVRFNPIVQSLSHNSITDEGETIEVFTNGSEISRSTLPTQSDKDDSTCQSGDNYLSTITSQFSQGSNFPDSSSTDTSSDIYPNNNRISYDKDRKIEAYVDFTQYYENVNIARLNGTLPSSINFD